MRKRKTGLKYFFLIVLECISMFFQLLLPLPKLCFKIDLLYCTDWLGRETEEGKVYSK